MTIHVAEGGKAAVAGMIEKIFGPGAGVAHEPDGSPYAIDRNGKRLPVNISVSHSRHYAAVAVHSSRRIGVDIEEPRLEQLTRVAPKFLNPAEQSRSGAALLTAWTAKEATFKAAGIASLTLSGITLSPDNRTATTPDGRRFELTTTITPAYTLTSALPYDSD